MRARSSPMVRGCPENEEIFAAIDAVVFARA